MMSSSIPPVVVTIADLCMWTHSPCTCYFMKALLSLAYLLTLPLNWIRQCSITLRWLRLLWAIVKIGMTSSITRSIKPIIGNCRKLGCTDCSRTQLKNPCLWLRILKHHKIWGKLQLRVLLFGIVYCTNFNGHYRWTYGTCTAKHRTCITPTCTTDAGKGTKRSNVRSRNLTDPIK